MTLKPKISIPIKISWLKDAIYFVGIGITIFFYFRDKAVENAKRDMQIQQVIEQQAEIIKQLEENNDKWLDQKLTNGKIIEFIDITSNHQH